MTEPSGLSANYRGSPLPSRLRLLARQLTRTALDLIFPPRCIQCGRVGSLFCATCQQQIVPTAPIVEQNGPLSERRSTGEFGEGLQKAIHALKYSGRFQYAELLGERLVEEFRRTAWQATLVTAAPLHESRRQARGYNQAELLASYLAAATGIQFQPDAIVKTRDTKPQVGLGFQERQMNVADAFKALPELVLDQQIVIIDDVYTTGATLRACAHALLEAGASKVWALTVASARSN